MNESMSGNDPHITAKDDGGPAFPEHHYFDPGRGEYGMHMTASDIGCGGMSLRDWFAGQALISLWDCDDCNESAKRAYKMADAMLAERKK